MHNLANFPYPPTSRLRKMFDFCQDVICSIDINGTFVEINKASVQVWGYYPEELIGRSCLELVAKEDRLRTEAVFRKVVGNEPISNFENRYCRKDGSMVPLIWACQWDADEELLFCFVTDASEKKAKEALRKQYEQEIRQHNAEMLDMLERITDGFIAVDMEWNITYINPQVEKMVSVKREDYLHKNVWEVFPELVGSVFYEQYHKAYREKIPVHFEAFFSPFKVWLEVNAYPSENGLSIFFIDSTQKKKTQDELRKLSLIVRNTENMVLVTDAQGRIEWANHAFIKGTGYSLEEVLGEYPARLLHGPDTDPGTVQQVIEQVAQGKSFRVELLNYTKEKEPFWSDIYFQPVLDEKGNVQEYFSIQTDITKRKNVEAELRKLSFVAQLAHDIVVISSPDRKIVWANDAFSRITGYRLDEVMGKEIGSVFDGPGTDAGTIAHVNAKVTNREAFRIEVLNYKKSGETYWADVSCQPVFDERGHLKHFFSIATDITERKKAEEEIQKLSLIARKTMTSVIMLTTKNRITWVNEAFIRLTGYTLEEVLGKQPCELIDGPETNRKTVEYIWEQQRKGDSYHVEILNYKKNGEKYWSEVYGQPLYDAKGKIQMFFSIETDITERKESEEELNRLSLIAKETINHVVVTDAQGKISWVNNAFIHKSGYTLEEAMGQYPGALLRGPETDPDMARYIQEQVMKGEAFHVEILNYTKTMEKYWVEIHAQPVYNAEGKVKQYFALQTDITERKQLQEQLLREQKYRQQMITAAAINAQEQ